MAGESGPFVAADLGAESGRVVVGSLSGGQLSLEEVHRFANQPVEVRGTLHWDVLSLYRNVLEGIRECVARHGDAIEGIGVDTWAVDFGLLARDGSLLQNPVHYRDGRTEGIPQKVTSTMPEEEIYRHTGINLLPIYTLCQMVALKTQESPLLEAADGFLMMPDLLGYFLSGRRACERTNAITTQLYNPRSGGWDEEIFGTFGLPLEIMPDITDPGTVLGELGDAARRETGVASARVVAPCTHDTGSAVAAVPGEGDDWLFLSCGTWSILGALTEDVVTSHDAFVAGMCNEMTFGSLFLCRNIMGLWILQQARAAWLRQGSEHSYGELARLAAEAPAGGPLIYPDDECFLAPDDMLDAIGDFCARTGQEPPTGVAAVSRCIVESLAFCFRHNADRLAEILDRQFKVLHIVGGGTHNELLCQLAADATGMPVVAGPAEATVTGNLLVQAAALGYLEGPGEVRQTVRTSFRLERYEPRDRSETEEHYERYLQIVEGVE